MHVRVPCCYCKTQTRAFFCQLTVACKVFRPDRALMSPSQILVVVSVVFGVLILAMAVFTCKNGGGGGKSDEPLKSVTAFTDYNVVQSEIQNANLSPSRPPGSINMTEV